MKPWQRRILAILTLGGSFLGGVLSLGYLSANTIPVRDKFFVLISVAMYSWGVWCGTLLLESRDGAIAANRTFWAIQIPYLTSPIAGYIFASGAFLYVTFQPFALRFDYLFLLGSKFEFSLLQPAKSFVVGINVLAAGVYLFLHWSHDQNHPHSGVAHD